MFNFGPDSRAIRTCLFSLRNDRYRLLKFWLHSITPFLSLLSYVQSHSRSFLLTHWKATDIRLRACHELFIEADYPIVVLNGEKLQALTNGNRGSPPSTQQSMIILNKKVNGPPQNAACSRSIFRVSAWRLLAKSWNEKISDSNNPIFRPSSRWDSFLHVTYHPLTTPLRRSRCNLYFDSNCRSDNQRDYRAN